MLLKNYFIKATEEYTTFEKSIPAYYFRRAFKSQSKCNAKITIAVCGFYEIYLNGKRITRGFLSPYISNTNHYIYFDEYNVTLDKGENAIGVILGNGFQNNPSGYVWDFDKADFRSAPMFSLLVTENDNIILNTENFKIAPSPIRRDDYRFGEFYDANYEIDGWNEKGFDDSDWEDALKTSAPKGELRKADIPPIIKEKELSAISITRCGDSFIYDFGESNAGICRLKVKGTKGQKIELRYADELIDGDLNLRQIWFPHLDWERDKEIVHKDTYICKGESEEIYEPTFTYHGFRYVKVSGITEEQATRDLICYLVYHTELETFGDFRSSDEISTKLQEITRRSIISNFHHFPTDCPQREKNGWTADAALTCETALLNFNPEINYREWMRNICKAQAENGSLPGIIPTGGWGFEWGNGPAWDCVLAQIPYFTYIYRGKTDMILESAPHFIKYLKYLRSRTDENGLLSIGLGDWCHVGGREPKAPLILTDSIMAMDTAIKISQMLRAVDMQNEADFAGSEAEKYKVAIRANLIDFETMTSKGNCQTSQALCLHYGIFDEREENTAFLKLLELVHEADDHIDVGVLGARVIFHVLTKFGASDLAYKMITREDYPSYGNLLKRGATTLWEDFLPKSASSMNHHFWGDISAWFIKCIVGINLNPNKDNVNTLKIKPSFISLLDWATAYHKAPAGEISVSWKREGDDIILDVKIPQAIDAVAELEEGFMFESAGKSMPITSGTYKVISI